LEEGEFLFSGFLRQSQEPSITLSGTEHSGDRLSLAHQGENPVSQLTFADLSDKMRDIDFAMLSTHAEGGEIAGRPMSNNGDVAYEGDSYFFSYEDTRTVDDIKRDPKVSLAFQGSKSLLGKPPLFIAVEGRAELIRDKKALSNIGRRISKFGSRTVSTHRASSSSRFTQPASITGMAWMRARSGSDRH
jgi:general stress protein 26